MTMASSKAQVAMGQEQRALRYARLAVKLDPASDAAQTHLAALEAPTLAPGAPVIEASRTTSTATTARPGKPSGG